MLTSCCASESSIIRRAAYLDKNFELGALHTALSVNGVVLEWGRGLGGQSLVCPTLDVLGLLLAIEKKLTRADLAETCIAYNRLRYYDAVLNNCQNFVCDIFKKADIEYKFEKFKIK